jgi:mxaC protein
MSLGFMNPGCLPLLILAIVPWLRRGQATLSYPALALIPMDPLSLFIDRALRGVGVMTVLSLGLGSSGPFLKEQWVERIGVGAHIVLLLDRSSSMNENFTGRYLGARATESKSAMARKLLSEFVGRREHDLFGMVAFAATPIYVFPLTDDRVAIQAAISGAGGRGHGLTHIASGLAMALDLFVDHPLTGSRIILLVSDGAARIDEETRERLRQRFLETEASLYWIYLRNPTSAPLSERPANPNESTTPEYFLNEYFKSLGVGYRAFEAENPNAMEKAIEEVERLENGPLIYREKLPRKDLSNYFYGLAVVCLGLLMAAKRLEVKRWNH